MTETELQISSLVTEFSKASPVDIVDRALAMFGDDLGIAFSGAEDVVLIEYAKQTGRRFRVFSLDTGRLHAETYRLFDAVERHFNIRIEYLFPESASVERLVRAKGLFSFMTDGHQECCGVRKVEPLKRHLSTLKAWMTGQRRDQSPIRAAVPLVQLDPVFRGLNQAPLMKFNPLANASSADVWATIRALGLPFNALHERGFISIGCEPCTRPVLPGQHEREGRWWWEEATKKECGLHAAK